MNTAWCGSLNGRGSAIATTTDGQVSNLGVQPKRPQSDRAEDTPAPRLVQIMVASRTLSQCEDDLPANHCNGQFRADGK